MTITVLVVDESPCLRGLVATTLREAGCRVIEVTDSQEGLDRALALPTAALITDQHMPNLDGLGFIWKFREHLTSKGKPIIFLSTDSADSLQQQARDAGALGRMVKPFTRAQLLAVIKKVLG